MVKEQDPRIIKCKLGGYNVGGSAYQYDLHNFLIIIATSTPKSQKICYNNVHDDLSSSKYLEQMTHGPQHSITTLL